MYTRINAYVFLSVIWLLISGCAEKSTVATNSSLDTYQAPAPGKILFMNFTIYTADNPAGDSVKLGKWQVVSGNITPPRAVIPEEGDLIVQFMNDKNEIRQTVNVSNPVNVHVETFALASGEHSQQTVLDSASFFIRTIYKPDLNQVRVLRYSVQDSRQLLKTSITD